ncbi:MAG: hypothetical protein ACJAVK_000511 [Akkermansiaceae bacterium]|jgi:hypothetical protein
MLPIGLGRDITVDRSGGCVMNRKLSDRWHGPFWLGGILLALLPFLIAVGFDGPRAPWVKGAGSFGDNVVLAIWWGLGGAALGGLIWTKLSGRTMVGSFRRWCGAKHRFHWMWFILSVGIWGVHNYLSLEGFRFTLFEKMSTMLGRVLTGAVMVGGYWIACGLAGALAPKRMRRWPWGVAAFLPFVILADFIAILYWKNPVVNLLNQLDEEGKFELGASIASSGVAIPPWAVVIGFLSIVWAFYLVFHWFAGRNWASRVQITRWIVVVFIGGLWGGVLAEKALGTIWKSRNAQRWGHNAYDLHLTKGFEPPLGVAEFQVKFYPKALSSDESRPAADGKQPDIFIIMMESTRQDAIAPEHAPFLAHFRDEECQDLGQTWAASNSTALSWYGLFHGVLPVFWAGEKASYVSTKELATPAWFDLLKRAEYRMEIRTVCDLSYRNMGATSFGTQQDVFKAYTESPVGDIHWQDYYEGIPEREKESFASTLNALQVSPSSGNFHFIALDSTHYGYRWHESFDPPYPDYHDDAGVPGFPNDEDIASIKRRYHNAVAWVDFQVEEFVLELKRQGRYDDSVIIVTGDHGEEFHENGSWFHSSSLLPAQTQVPILIKWPQGVEAPPQSSASHLDLVPSLRDLLGFPDDPSFLGRSLLKPLGSERTQMTFACNTGVTGVCMAWYRDGWVATFRWENPFSYGPPDKIHLDDIIGPKGSALEPIEPADWQALLLEKFPDAPGRLFEEFNLTVPEP